MSISRGSLSGVDQQRAVLERVLAESLAFLDGLPTRPVNARADVDDVAAALGGPLPDAAVRTRWP